MNISIREKQVLDLISYELSIHEIASELNISHHTVATHRKNLLRKLKVKNTAGMIRKGFEFGFLNSERVVPLC